VKIGDLVRYKESLYKDKEPLYKWSCWTAIVVEVLVPEWEKSDIDYIKVVWNQDPSEGGLIRANLMEIISESR
jgi:hypothetical protein